MEVILTETEQCCGIPGIIHGEKTKGIETDSDIKAGMEFLRKIASKRV